MSVYRTGSGASITLGREIGRGGEGAVYAIAGTPDRVAKIYLGGKEGDRQDKITAMVANGLAARSDLVAFPADMLSDAQGRFRGFTMRFAAGSKPVHELYSPTSRRASFPDADFRFICRTAANVARAVASVHATNCVIGDINRSGFLINRQALVTLIDADSFQVTSGGTTYRCRVAVPEYTPPELQLVDPAGIDRAPQHDAFGLAVILFQLLFLGRHPYAGVFNGPTDGSLDDAIRQGRFAYSIARRSATKTQPPQRAALLSDLPKPIGQAFERAFTADQRQFRRRPTAEEWVGLLVDLEGKLRVCAANPRHHYWSRAIGCPWCRIEAGSSIRLFDAAPPQASPIKIALSARPSSAGPGSPVAQPVVAQLLVSPRPPSHSQGRTSRAPLFWLLALAGIGVVWALQQPRQPPSGEPQPPPVVAETTESPTPARALPSAISTTPAAVPVVNAPPQVTPSGATAGGPAGTATAAKPSDTGPAAPAQGSALPAAEVAAAAAPPGTTAAPPPLSSAEIARLQAALAALGYDVGPIDGVSGGRTRRAALQYAATRALDPAAGQLVLDSAEREAQAAAAAHPPTPADTAWPGFSANGIRLSPGALSLFSIDEAVDIQMAMLDALNQPGAADARTATSAIRVTGYQISRGTPCKTALVSLASRPNRPLQMTFCLGGGNAWTDIGG